MNDYAFYEYVNNDMTLGSNDDKQAAEIDNIKVYITWLYNNTVN